MPKILIRNIKSCLCTGLQTQIAVFLFTTAVNYSRGLGREPPSNTGRLTVCQSSVLIHAVMFCEPLFDCLCSVAHDKHKANSCCKWLHGTDCGFITEETRLEGRPWSSSCTCSDWTDNGDEKKAGSAEQLQRAKCTVRPLEYSNSKRGPGCPPPPSHWL